MSLPPAWPQVLDFFGTPLVLEPSSGQLSSQEPARPAVPSRLFTGFWYQAGTWPCARYVVAKAEANAQETNRRFVVSNRPGSWPTPSGGGKGVVCRQAE